MMSIPPTRNTPTMQETRPMKMMHGVQCKNMNTTQQWMTACFPGQPPDILQETSQNPPPSQV